MSHDDNLDHGMSELEFVVFFEDGGGHWRASE